MPITTQTNIVTAANGHSSGNGNGHSHAGGSIETIRQAVHEARAALGATLAAAGVDATKTRESARALNINRGLIWRISRAVGAEDDVTAATNLPGQVGLERLLEACRERGVGEDVLSDTRRAVESFHEVVDRHTGDRRTLEILLANAGGTNGNGSQATSLNMEGARRAMFDGGCAVWGVRAEVRLRCMFLAPSADGADKLDQADVAGYVGFRRLRQVPWPMSYKAVYTDSGSSDAPREDLIDQAGANGSSLPLLRDFCVPRDLSIHVVKTQRATRHELPPLPEEAGAATCVFGSICRGIYSARQTPECKMAGSLVVLDTPVERVMVDAFVHRSLGMTELPEVLLVDRLTRPHGYNEEEIRSDALPIEAVARRLGPGAAGATTPHVPWYPRLVERVCGRLGFRPEEFVAHRVEIVYPPIPTALVVRYRLPG